MTYIKFWVDRSSKIHRLIFAYALRKAIAGFLFQKIPFPHIEFTSVFLCPGNKYFNVKAVYNLDIITFIGYGESRFKMGKYFFSSHYNAVDNQN